jgi:O-antigen/teichoic acid export membrane protein
MLSAPVSVVIWLAAPGIVEHILGQKWAPILPLIQILVISAFVRSFAALGGALFQACDRPDLDLKMNLPRFVAVVSLIWPLTAWRGLEGASWVVLIAISSCLPVWFYGVWKLARLSISSALIATLPSLFCGSLLAGIWIGMETAIVGNFGSSMWTFAAIIVSAICLWLLVLRAIGRWVPSVDIISLIKQLT